MRLAAAALILGTAMSPLQAQYARTQDSSLVGLKRVYLNFEASEGALEPALAEQLQSTIGLELRKAGLRLVRDETELDLNQDGILNVSIVRVGRSMSTDALLRIDLEQNVQLARTKKALQTVTWFYEENGRNILMNDFAKAAITKGVNEFLSKWLDANGR